MVLCPWICFRISYFTVYGNLNRICILLLCENCINLNYVKLVHSVFRVYYIILLLCTFILLISESLILKLQLKKKKWDTVSMCNSTSTFNKGDGPFWGQSFYNQTWKWGQKAQLGFLLYSPVSVYMLSVYKQCVFWLLPITYYVPIPFNYLWVFYRRDLATSDLTPYDLEVTFDLGFQRLKATVYYCLWCIYGFH